MWVGAGLRPGDVGLRGEHFLPGIVGTVAFWVGVQLILLLYGVVSGAEIAWAERWSWTAPPMIAGALLAQLLGSALSEELVYRGFLIPQLEGLFRRLLPSHKISLVGAIVVSSAAFAAMHVPNLLRLGMDPGLQFLIPTFAGIVFSLLYVFSRNLFFVVGVHSVGNWGMPLVQAGLPVDLVVFGLRIVLVIALGVIARAHWMPGDA